jgi:hypothetical protein
MRILITIFSLAITCIGCASSAPPGGTEPNAPQPAAWSDVLSPPSPVIELDARVTPPADWKPDRLKTSERHQHQVWLSPTGETAYGVIYFTLPLPVGEELALRGFLAEMKKSEGEATLLTKNRDGERLRFVAEGGKYRIRGTLLTRGLRGWAVYAGTLRSRTVAVDDLALAVQARENTALGLD